MYLINRLVLVTHIWHIMTCRKYENMKQESTEYKNTSVQDSFFTSLAKKTFHAFNSGRRSSQFSISFEFVQVFTKNVTGSEGWDEVVKFIFLINGAAWATSQTVDNSSKLKSEKQFMSIKIVNGAHFGQVRRLRGVILEGEEIDLGPFGRWGYWWWLVWKIRRLRGIILDYIGNKYMAIYPI